MHKSNYRVTDDTILLTAQLASERYCLTPAICVERARQCGALLKIGRNVRIDVKVMDQYLREEFKVTS